MEHIALMLALVGLVGFAAQWLAWWVKLPAILFLLLSGLLLGPILGVLHPDELFGHLLFPVVSLAVAIILFEGSLTLKFSEIRGVESVIQRLVTIGAAVTWIVITCATHWLLGLSWLTSALFGALTVVTGPTVIVPMLRTVRPEMRIANILRWEGIIIDPIGALLAVLVYEFIVSGAQSSALGHTLLVFCNILFIGMTTGAVGGFALGWILQRGMLPEYLHNLATLSLVLGNFALANHLQEESGLLTVTVMGMWLANTRRLHVEDILNFKENLSILLISGLFIILAARIELSQIVALGWPALVLLLVIQLVARPLSVFASTTGSSLTWRARLLLAWIAPRGIVAAAVSALFALHLEEVGFAEAHLLAPLTFIVIIGTVVLQSATAGLLANQLKVSEPAPKGFLIIGANPVARAIAKALQAHGFRALLTDSNWDNVSAARMEGLETFYGNPTSAYADQHLTLVGIGRMLGISPRRETNTTAGLRFRHEFGKDNIFSILQTSATDKSGDKHRTATEYRGATLFGDDVTYSTLASLLGQDGEIRATTLTENFSFEDYLNKPQRKLIPLFALDAKKRLYPFVADKPPKPKKDWTIIGLVKELPETD